ncbi:uncharacterized protein [Argopecten irradians]|uniref:uncharacterized protein isoform X2 n=1 Tax=Argopecten irradians TaxID=31199 RepID=UPI00371E2C7E
MRRNHLGGQTSSGRPLFIATKMASRELQNSFVDSIALPSGFPPYNSVAYASIFQSKVPNINFQVIYDFMVNRKRPVGESGDGCHQLTSVKSYRSMDRAVAHYQAGDVQQIKFVEVDTDLIYGTAMVLASMKKTKYSVNIAFKNEIPIHAFCQCPIGLAQCCSHVGALLFAINGYHLEKDKENSQIPCTSRKCEWNVPRKLHMDPQPVNNMHFGKRTDCDKQSVLNFDPRHSSDRIYDQDHYTNMMMELKAVFPKSVHLLAPIDPSLSQYIEEKTRGQRESVLWQDLHKGRITSSVFGDILRAGGKPLSLIDRIMHGSGLERYSTLPKPIQWGIDHEREAVGDYIKLQNRVTSLSVSETGLTLLPSHPFIGASGDGKIIDTSMPQENNIGVLEIKCPYSVNGQLVNEMQVHEIVEMGSNDFCLQKTEEGTRLRRSHCYYAQVQGEMAVMGITWCDFVVWTSAVHGNCFIERVYFDRDFVSNMMPRLVEFYVKHILHD